MSRLLILLICVFIVWFGWTKIQALPVEKRQTKIVAITLWAIFGIALVLVILGRTHWVIAALAALGPALKFLFGIAIRSFPVLQAWMKAKSKTNQQSQPVASNNIDEAYQILGLEPGASKNEIVEAHKKLIQKNHPDRGGNDYLAAKLNQARDLLLKHVAG